MLIHHVAAESAHRDDPDAGSHAAASVDTKGRDDVKLLVAKVYNDIADYEAAMKHGKHKFGTDMKRHIRKWENKFHDRNDKLQMVVDQLDNALFFVSKEVSKGFDKFTRLYKRMHHNTDLKMKQNFNPYSGYFGLMARTISDRVSKMLMAAIDDFEYAVVKPATEQAEKNIEADDKAASRLKTVLSQQWQSAYKEAWKYVDDSSEGLVEVNGFDREAAGRKALFEDNYDRMIWKLGNFSTLMDQLAKEYFEDKEKELREEGVDYDKLIEGDKLNLKEVTDDYKSTADMMKGYYRESTRAQIKKVKKKLKRYIDQFTTVLREENKNSQDLSKLQKYDRRLFKDDTRNFKESVKVGDRMTKTMQKQFKDGLKKYPRDMEDDVKQALAPGQLAADQVRSQAENARRNVKAEIQMTTEKFKMKTDSAARKLQQGVGYLTQNIKTESKSIKDDMRNVNTFGRMSANAMRSNKNDIKKLDKTAQRTLRIVGSKVRQLIDLMHGDLNNEMEKLRESIDQPLHEVIAHWDKISKDLPTDSRELLSEHVKKTDDEVRSLRYAVEMMEKQHDRQRSEIQLHTKEKPAFLAQVRDAEKRLLEVAQTHSTMIPRANKEVDRLLGGGSQIIDGAVAQFLKLVEDDVAANTDAGFVTLNDAASELHKKASEVEQDTNSLTKTMSEEDSEMLDEAASLREDAGNAEIKLTKEVEANRNVEDRAGKAIRKAEDQEELTLQKREEMIEDSVSALKAALEQRLTTTDAAEEAARDGMDKQGRAVVDRVHNEVHVKLAALDAEVQRDAERTGKEEREARRNVRSLERVAEQLRDREVTAAHTYLADFGGLTSDVDGLWEQEATDLEDAEHLAKARSVSLAMLVDKSMGQVTEGTRTALKDVMDALDAEMARVKQDESLSLKERHEEMKRLQESARKEIHRLVDEDGKLGPLLQTMELESAASTVHEAKETGAVAKGAAELQKQLRSDHDLMHEEATAYTSRLLGSVEKAEEAAEAVVSSSGRIAARGADAREAAEVRNDAMADVRGGQDALRRAEEAAHESLVASERRQQRGADVLGRVEDALALAHRTASQESRELQLGVVHAKEKAEMAWLDEGHERDRLERKLKEIVGETRSTTERAVQQRLWEVLNTTADMKSSLARLNEFGHGDIAEVMRDSYEFSKKMLQSMVDMKMSMYNDAQLEKAVGQDESQTRAMYMNLRGRLMEEAKKATEQQSKLEDALNMQLQKFGIKGKAAAEHLALFLTSLQFQLKNADQTGFDNLVGDMFKQFGVNVDELEGIDQIMGGALSAMGRKQDAVHDLVDTVSRSVNTVEDKYNKLRVRVHADLSRDKQLALLSDEEIRQQIQRLKMLIAAVAAGPKEPITTTTTTSTAAGPHVAAPVADGPCTDTVGFDNGKGMNCGNYTDLGWCAEGQAVAGAEWTLGEKYKYPEQNCCVCGKGGANAAAEAPGAALTTTAATSAVSATGSQQAAPGMTPGTIPLPAPGDATAAGTTAQLSASPAPGATVSEPAAPGTVPQTPMAPGDGTPAAVCVDTDAFDNGQGMNCAKYAENKWCAGGKAVAGAEWTLGEKYKYPEQNCCVCGKTGTGGPPAAGPKMDIEDTAAMASAASCKDTVGFDNGQGMNCAKYVENKWCAEGQVVAGAEWTLGEKYKHPEQNCCVCGKGGAPTAAVAPLDLPAAAPALCTDTAAFDNGKGMSCAKYAENGWCADGKVVAGAEWTQGAQYKYPEQNCCVCGKNAPSSFVEQGDTLSLMEKDKPRQKQTGPTRWAAAVPRRRW